MQYRRAKVEGGTYFFTLVTHNRRKFLCQPENISLLREAFRYVIERHPFKIDAIVILPEHLHCIWTLSFHLYVRKGIYQINWGANREMVFPPHIGHE